MKTLCKMASSSANWWILSPLAPSTRSIPVALVISKSAKISTSINPDYIKTMSDLIHFFFWFDLFYRFQEACKKYGVPESDIFQTIDLSEKKDIAMVTSTIFGLGSAVSQYIYLTAINNSINIDVRLWIIKTYKHPEYQGPSLGPKPSEKNQRNFSEEQLKAGQTVIGLQAGTNKGATQAGLNMGASRKILLGK